MLAWRVASERAAESVMILGSGLLWGRMPDPETDAVAASSPLQYSSPYTPGTRRDGHEPGQPDQAGEEARQEAWRRPVAQAGRRGAEGHRPEQGERDRQGEEGRRGAQGSRPQVGSAKDAAKRGARREPAAHAVDAPAGRGRGRAQEDARVR